MRKIIIIEFMTIDGVMQAPGGQDEDTSGNFKYGGWVAPYWDEYASQIMSEQMLLNNAEILLGRKTYEIFASYWPHHGDEWPGINEVKKYVASSDTSLTMEWQNSTLLSGNVVQEIKKMKEEDGPNLNVWGSGNLVQLLLKHDLADELWLKTFPIVLGSGKKLFSESAIPTAFTLTNNSVTPSGVIIANYKRAGEVKTGTVGE